MKNKFNIDKLLDNVSKDLQTFMKQSEIKEPVMVGIHSAGFLVAKRLHEMLKIEEPLGALNSSFYRDDFSRIGLHPQTKPSQLPFDLENKHIILVDDVLYTGRTIRAAMNELFDYGRPASITLAVLMDRTGARELPIEAQIVGTREKLDADKYCRIEEQDGKLTLDIIHRDEK
ncbi:MAG TPA: bifunctional pyr operon transcriptional regulator/uracil phosphoribosyltransferase PyrR [Leucothrix mucor]|nr:bifunctional pyr operon transcriptional regulator/uracil phosphoribosyltransferase PyrR [Leucothrix mucor]